MSRATALPEEIRTALNVRDEINYLDSTDKQIKKLESWGIPILPYTLYERTTGSGKDKRFKDALAVAIATANDRTAKNSAEGHYVRTDDRVDIPATIHPNTLKTRLDALAPATDLKKQLQILEKWGIKPTKPASMFGNSAATLLERHSDAVNKAVRALNERDARNKTKKNSAVLRNTTVRNTAARAARNAENAAARAAANAAAAANRNAKAKAAINAASMAAKGNPAEIIAQIDKLIESVGIFRGIMESVQAHNEETH